MEVYFNLPGNVRVFAGTLTGFGDGNVTTWEDAVANGTTHLLGWSTTVFTLDAATLAALSGVSSFVLELDVENSEETGSWAAVIDYATLTLEYEPGAANPNVVPEPGTIALLGAGLAGLVARRRRRARSA
jgi:hypothetical protein